MRGTKYEQLVASCRIAQLINQNDELDMARVLICGANRGIGLELCRQYSSRGDQVIATCRSMSDELAALDVQAVTDFDVVGSESIHALKQQMDLDGTRIDILVHNAGILTRESLDNMDFEAIERQFHVNTMGPLRMVHGLLDSLAEDAKIGLVSSRMGSMGDNGSGGGYGYRMSKAGLNAFAVSLARDLAERGIAVVVLHPGLVATRMTGGNGISPAQAATGLIERMDELSLERSGKFMHAEGYELPW